MSVLYTLYTEAYMDEHWVCMNRAFPAQAESHGESIIPTHESGSRSYFGEASRKLKSLGSQVQLTALSIKLQTRFSSWLNDEMYCLLVIPFEKIDVLVPNRSAKEHHGFVLKDDVFSFEANETEDIDTWLSANEYQALDSET